MNGCKYSPKLSRATMYSFIIYKNYYIVTGTLLASNISSKAYTTGQISIVYHN